MSVPSMVHRSGDSLIVRSVVSGDALFGSADAVQDANNDDDDVGLLFGHPPSASGTLIEKDLPACKVKRNYLCGTCDYFTQNPRSYLYHLRDVHAENVKIFECPNCLYASKHFQKLLRHTKMVHGGGSTPPESASELPKTSQSASSSKNQKPNLQQSEEEGENSAAEPEDSSGEDRAGVFKCSVCTFTAKTRAQLGRHEREEHIKTKFFRCTKCTYVTHMKARFTKHVKYHSMPMIKCDMCDFRTPYKWNLDRHCKNHNGRGAFRCSACNFTADIKQSLTVHEMNHHVPPVGQAAGLGVGRRRNKVGASDATAAEEAARHQEQVARGDPIIDKTEVSPQPPAKKQKVASTTHHHHHHQHSPEQGSFGPDFIHPDDIIHHANGNVYIKNKCKLCNFKSAWAGEMAKHEKKVHNIVNNNNSSKDPINKASSSSSSSSAKKTIRPIPNLIPLPAQTSVLKLSNKSKRKSSEEPVMSQQDMKEICAKSVNSSLKDFASLFGSEDVFKDAIPSPPDNIGKVPDLIPTSSPLTKSPQRGDLFKQKNASFFDTLKERLMTGAAGSGCNLVCEFCGHESKCLTESVKHSKRCGKESCQVRRVPSTFVSSSRCQFCRQRCKSSTDLYNHIQTCAEALKALKTEDSETSEGELKIDETQSEDEQSTKPHPMENRVFVWNNIVVPMDIEVDDSKYEYTEDKVDDNVSLDLSVRTQSPGGSESSYVGQEYHHSPVPDKIPTHGNDISVAQHKRVFKCPHCSFWASTASRFHVHIVGHLNKKPFECSLCAYRSNWRWDITKHIKLKSVRDPAHEEAKVLMTDETGRRNYTKYNKYLTEIHVSGEQSLETSGGSGTRPKHHDRNSSPSLSGSSKSEMPKLTRAPPSGSGDFSQARTPALRPPPPLKAADGSFFAKVVDKKRNNAESKRTLFKCKKCNFRDASREILLAHVKGHYPQNGGNSSSNSSTHDLSLRGASPDKDEASVCSMTAKGSQAPFRCGHCNQVSNWKHVIQRHCRLKHSGDIRVVSNKNGQEKLEVEDQMDEPDHVDVSQDGAFKCHSCPFSCDGQSEFKTHTEGHKPDSDSIMKCCYCTFFVSRKEDILEHFKLHGIGDPDDFLCKMLERNNMDGDLGKRFKCLVCPYVTNSKSQFTYHKQFHKPKGYQYNCSKCSYNVSKRHLLHQHLKVHGINVTPQKQNGDVVDLDDISDEIEEVPQAQPFDSQHFQDIPLVWVSKGGKFSKMFKCRFCPHVNLRKVNIQEHEKMHSIREKNPNSSRCNEIEHRCADCNYVCNNAGVLSSHSKVHQGLYGTVHCLVDQVKSDEEQIRELTKFINPLVPHMVETINLDNDYENPESSNLIDSEEQTSDDSVLFFCEECPARFLKETEFKIHARLHGVRLFYKCDHCSYSARQKPHLLAHVKVHTNEYQDRTKVLMSMYMGVNSPPQTYPINTDEGEDVWMVYPTALTTGTSTKSDLDLDLEALAASSKQFKSTNVPLSGTELFQQKSEAEQKQQAQMSKEMSPPSPRPTDPQFGTLMNGNPDFIYPTYLRNGRMREKRYKCPKCPSAFEKREQYKVHLNLHGSKQRYRCEQCDYSVKYYANYVQHVKKHKMNSEAHAARRGSNEDIDEAEEIQELQEGNEKNGLIKLSVGDQQAYQILKQRLIAGSPHHINKEEEKKTFYCMNCPYVNYRKDAVDNHQKRHQSVSGVKNTFTCDHCDYSVPQVHFLRDHTKLHFMPNKSNSQVDGYMVCDNLKLVSQKVADSDGSDSVKSDSGDVIFEERSEDRSYLPVLSSEIAERFNNNDGEKQFVKMNSGEVLVTAEKLGDKSSNSDDTKMEEC